MEILNVLQKQELLAHADRAVEDSLVQSFGTTSAMLTSLPPGFIAANGDQPLTALWQFSKSNPTVLAQITALKKRNCYKLDSCLRNTCKGWRYKRHMKKVTTSTNNAISTTDCRGFSGIASQLDAAQATT